MSLEEEKQMAADVVLIKNALIGNDDLGQIGLVAQVKQNANYIQEDRYFKAKALGALTALQLMAAWFFDWTFGKH